MTPHTSRPCVSRLTRSITICVWLVTCFHLQMAGSASADGRSPATPATAESSIAGDFDGDGHTDLLSVPLNGQEMILKFGGPRGDLLASQRRSLPGRVTAWAVGEVNRRDGLLDLAVAIEGPAGPALLVFESPAGAFAAEPERFALPATADDVLLGRFDEDPYRDITVILGEEVRLIHGRERRLSWQSLGDPVPAARVQQLSLDSPAFAASPELMQRRLLARARQKTAAGGLMFAVNSSGDEEDFVAGDGSCATVLETCTLRAAIEEANASAGLDTILFTSLVDAPIFLALPLRATDAVFIDGASHPEFAGSPVVELAAGGLSGGSAIELAGGSDGSTVKALVIHSAPEAGVRISGSGGNTIIGNYIGTDVDGSSAFANEIGIRIVGTSVGNTIGGTTPGDGNLISGNTIDGIDLEVNMSLTGTLIQGNLIGTDATGLAALGNGEHGINVASPSGTIGGTEAGARNVIAWNGMHGIFMRDDDNLVQGNWIGLNAEGVAAGNLEDGIHFGPPGAGATTIGGTAPGAGNVISGNVRDGIRIRVGADTVVQGNFIGTDPTGLLDRGNGGFGVCDGCVGGFRNIIGGTVAGAGNVISSNALGGYGTGTFDSVVQGNIVGLGVDGETLLGNGDFGVANADTVGGSDPLAGNLISANVGVGVRVGTDAFVLGNRIGVTTRGTAAGNGDTGVEVLGSRVAVGGTDEGESNLIAFNGGAGVSIELGLLNTVSGNSIFDNEDLGIDLDDDGVTANDPGDGDTGSNELQNFPVLTEADGGLRTVSGTLDGVDGQTHVVEVFSSASCDASGHGEGRTFLGSGEVTTGGDAVDFEVTMTRSFVAGVSITATARNPAGSTSEFSACLVATATESPIFSDGFESGDTSAWK